MNRSSPVSRLQDAPADVRGRLREQFIAWLQDPEHEALQIRERLFAPSGPAGGCCALGGLLTVLAAGGYAHIVGDGASVRIEVPGQGVVETMLGQEGLCEATGELPEELAQALGLRLSLETITALNDGPCVPHAFWDIAERLQGPPHS